MTARSPTAFATSLLLHAVFVAMLFFSAWVLRDEVVNTRIIELVAGAGSNYGATEAPALGSEDSANLQAAPAEASPIIPQPMEAVTAPPAKAQAAPKVPDFSKRLDRAADRAENRRLKALEKQRAKDEAARAKKEAAEKAKAEAAAKQPRMTKQEFDRLYGKKLAQQKAPAGVAVKKIDVKGVAGGVVGGSVNVKEGAGGTALQREEADMLDGYFSYLIQRLREEHERPTGVSDLLTAKAEFYIDQDGTISRVRIVRSSGNAEFDQSVLSAFRNVGSIGRRPDSGGTLRREVTFKMRDD